MSCYIIVSVKDYEKIIQIISQISKKGENIAMTAAAKLRQEGIEQGIEQGIKQGTIKTQKNTILKLYKKAKLTVQQIVDCLEVDKSFVENTLKENGLAC